MTTTCHRVRKPIKVGVDIREPGDLVPEALQWKGHVLARMEQTMFIQRTQVLDGELESALSYCEPEVWELHGLSTADYEAGQEAIAERVAAQTSAGGGPISDFQSGETSVYEVTPEEVAAGDEVADLIVDDVPSLISEPIEPTPLKYQRAHLESLPWPELRALGAGAGLGRGAKKATIIDALAGD